MIQYLTCEAMDELVQAFVDNELAVDEQVAVESHLRWCRVCANRVTDLQLIGSSVRLGAPAWTAADDDEHDLAAIQSGVLARIRAEREQSLGTRVRALCADRRLLWPAIGATAAVMACLFAAIGVFTAATERENSESMAGMIQLLANRLSVPRALDAGMVVDSIKADEAVYALSAVVTKEGRIENYELLTSDHVTVPARGRAAQAHELAALLNAVKQSRFEPAQTAAGGPVTVNMVWLMTRTTVKGSASVQLQPLRAPGISPGPPKRTEDPPAGRRGAPRPSPTA